MVLLFVINIILYFFLQILKLKYISSYFKNQTFLSTNPFVLIFLFKLPIDVFKMFIGPGFLLERGVSDIYYNFALFVTSLSVLIEYLLLRFSFAISNRVTFKSSTFNIKTKSAKMLIAAILFYVLYLLSFIKLATNSFGLINWLSDPRTGYQLYRTGAGQFWVFSISFLSISFAIATLYIKKYSNLFIILIPYIFSSYLLGSKGIVLDFMLFFLIVLWLKRYRPLKKVFVLFLPIAFAVMIINFLSTTSTSINGINLTSIFSYFDYYVNSAMYYREYFKGNIDLFYGKIYFTEFWSLIPRGLYSDKPYVYGITYVNEFFFPGAAEETNFPAFGGPINFFADFGLLGVVLFTFLDPFKFIYYFFLGQLLKNYDYEKIKNNLFLFLLFLYFTSPFFLFSLSFPLNMIFLFMVSMIILVMNKISFYK